MEKRNRTIVIRVRGSVGVSKEIEDTLQMLHLNRVNHAVLVDNRPNYQGMLQKTKDFITWGEINSSTLTKLLKKRAELIGKKPLTDSYLQENTDYKSIEEFVKAYMNFKAELNHIPKLKPVFRLHPPKGGYEGIKRSFKERGALGYRGKEINDLLRRMI